MTISLVGAGPICVGSDTVDVYLPEGVADNNLLVLAVSVQSENIAATPTGWTPVCSDTLEIERYYFYVRTADSEPSYYTVTAASSSGDSISGVIGAYRGGIGGLDTYSNTPYKTNDSTLRAGTVTPAQAGSPCIFVGVHYRYMGLGYTCTPPSSPGSWVEDFDDINDVFYGDIGVHFYHTTLSSTSPTGNIDATLSGSTSDKHAVALVFEPVIPVSVDGFLLSETSKINGFDANLISKIDGIPVR
jgi:hypothetical protein